MGYFMFVDIFSVNLSKKALKQLKTIPKPIVVKLLTWVEAIELKGLREIRKLPGFNDEPLKGKRRGQRSIRLNRSYRAIYSIKKNKVEFIFVEEVNKHEY